MIATIVFAVINALILLLAVFAIVHGRKRMKCLRIYAGMMLCLCVLSGCTKTQSGHVTEELFYLVTEKSYTFLDGTYVNLWRPELGGRDEYRLPNDTIILTVIDPRMPSNIFGDVEQLNETAQEQILAFYEKQGLLYNVSLELKRAYAEYLTCQDSGATFYGFQVGQETSPSASNADLIFFQTTVSLPISGQTVQEIHKGAVFDKQTGAVLSNWDLFSLPKEEVVARLLIKANIWDDELFSEMQEAMQPEYITLFSDSLQISFPQGSLHSQQTRYDLGLTYEELKDVMHAWAIPTPAPS